MKYIKTLKYILQVCWSFVFSPAPLSPTNSCLHVLYVAHMGPIICVGPYANVKLKATPEYDANMMTSHLEQQQHAVRAIVAEAPDASGLSDTTS